MESHNTSKNEIKTVIPYSYTVATGDGITTLFPFSFVGPAPGYLIGRTGDISVWIRISDVENERYDKYYLFDVQREFPSPNTIELQDAPEATLDGSPNIRIRRIMPKETPYLKAYSDAIFRSIELNNTFLQQLYVTHELLDGYGPIGTDFTQDLNMNEHYIINVAEGRNTRDAVNLGQLKAVQEEIYPALEAAWKQAARAEAEADRSEKEADKSLDSAKKGEGFKDEAEVSATKAKESAADAEETQEEINDYWLGVRSDFPDWTVYGAWMMHDGTLAQEGSYVYYKDYHDNNGWRKALQEEFDGSIYVLRSRESVINKFKGNQNLQIAGNTGHPVPNKDSRDYPSASEVSAGWIVPVNSELIGCTRIQGILQARKGKISRKISVVGPQLIGQIGGVIDYKGDFTITGVKITNEGDWIVVEVDMAQHPEGIKWIQLSGTEGVSPELTNEEAERAYRGGYIIITGRGSMTVTGGFIHPEGGYAHVYEDGYVNQFVTTKDWFTGTPARRHISWKYPIQMKDEPDFINTSITAYGGLDKGADIFLNANSTSESVASFFLNANSLGMREDLRVTFRLSVSGWLDPAKYKPLQEKTPQKQ